MEGSARGEVAARRWIITFLTVAGLVTSVVGSPGDRTGFQMEGHLIALQVSVGGVDGLTFALDTGASVSVISPRVASQLQAEAEKGHVKVWGYTKPAQVTMLPRLRIGNLNFDGLRALVMEVPSVGGTRIDGLIGLDVLRQVSVTIDFKNRQIRFDDPQELPQSVSFYNRLPYIPLVLQIGKVITRVKLDTGAPGLVLDSSRTREGPIAVPNGKRVNVAICGGRAVVQRALVGSLRLGDDSWTGVETFLLFKKRKNYSQLVGNLGVDGLGLSVLQIEMSEGRLSWSR